MRYFFTIGQYRSPKARVPIRVWACAVADYHEGVTKNRDLLDAGKHHCAPLQEAWTRLGPSAFRWELIDHWEPKDDEAKRAEWRDKLGLGDRRRSFHAMAKPRARRTDRPTAKLREADIVPIFQAHADGRTVAELAAQYGVNYRTMWKALARVSWPRVAIEPALLARCPLAANGTSPKALSRTDVDTVRQLLAEGATTVEIAARFKVTQQGISKILYGATYRSYPMTDEVAEALQRRQRREGEFAKKRSPAKQFIPTWEI
jgi:hypothetical protein